MEIRPVAAQQPQAFDPKLTNAALGFEQLLVQQLAESLVSSTEGEDEGAGTSLYRDMLPEALSESVKQAGGIGFAQSLAQSPVSFAPGTGDAAQ